MFLEGILIVVMRLKLERQNANWILDMNGMLLKIVGLLLFLKQPEEGE